MIYLIFFKILNFKFHVKIETKFRLNFSFYHLIRCKLIITSKKIKSWLDKIKYSLNKLSYQIVSKRKILFY